MKTALLATLAFVLALCSCGETPEPVPVDTDVSVDTSMVDDGSLGIVTLANGATEAVRSVSYRFRSYGTGYVESQMPVIEGSTRMLETDVPGVVLLDVRMTVTLTDSTGETSDLELAGSTDGETVWLSDSETMEFTTSPVEDGGEDLLNPLMAGIMYEYLIPMPFGDEMGAASLTLEGVEEVDGVECSVVLVEYSQGSNARWHFGVEDNLPRRVERLLEDGNGSQVLELSSLETDVEMDPSSFVMECPEGYETVVYSSFLPVGSAPPDWTLLTTDGDSLTLSTLEGGMVILDFWATWCGPCQMVMPSLQEIHEEHGADGVTVIGVNTWESGDPAAFMAENGYTYTVVLGGDEVAAEYLVTGIPTFYVIGSDGLILGAFRGADPANEAALLALIDANAGH